MGRGLSKHFEKITADHKGRWQLGLADMGKAVEDLSEGQRNGSLFDAWQAYWKDAAQRAVLTMDVLRQRGDIFLEHEEAGCPPVLIYDYDVVMDGADLPRPCCYQLLRIKAPDDGEHREIKPWKRPLRDH
jgi:hypothetical protein